MADGDPNNGARSARVRVAAVGLLLLALAFLLYARTLSAPFYFDDTHNILDNEQLRITALSIEQLRSAAFESGLTRPVAYLTFAINYWVGEYEPLGYHVVNVAIHGLNALLVYLLALVLLARRVPDPRPAALLAALLFLAHPIQTQSVSYIVQRMTSLAAGLYLGALLLWIRGRFATGGARWSWWGSALAVWLLALGSKEIAITWPGAVLLVEFFVFGGAGLRGRRSLVLLGICAAVGVLGAVVFVGSDPIDALLDPYRVRDFTLLERVMTEWRVVVWYGSLILLPLPSRLSLEHDLRISHGLLDPATTLLSLLALAGLVAVAWRLRERQPVAAFAVVWFLLHLALESTVIGLELVFEHRLYLPLVGPVIAVALLVAERSTPRNARAVGSLLVLLLAAGTLARNETWRDPALFWSDAIEKAPGSYRAYNNLAVALEVQDRRIEAVDLYQRAVELDPRQMHVHNNLGVALEKVGREEDAIARYREAIRIGPRDVAVHNNLSRLLAKRGEMDEAETHSRAVLEQEPEDEEALNQLAFLLDSKGEPEAAAIYYQKAIAVNPEWYRPRYNLARIRDMQGRLPEAIAGYREALELEPHQAEPHNNLGVALARMGDHERAIHHYEEALRLDPDNAEARANLANSLAMLGRAAEAIAQLRAVIELDPEDGDAHNNLGVALARSGDLAGAARHFREAVRIDPTSAGARDNLARAEAALTDTSKAR